MKQSTASILAQTTSAFYAQVSSSFSKTRTNPWQGWQRCADIIEDLLPLGDADSALQVLDIACGNLRFERFLEERFSQTAFIFDAVDNCLPLVCANLKNPENATTEQTSSEYPSQPFRSMLNLYETDVVQNLINQTSQPFGDIRHCNLAVSFGFMHHIPSEASRMRFLQEALNALDPEGIAVLSFWRFADDERLLEKAQKNTPNALEMIGLQAEELDENDYFLGWQEQANVYRYCHHFPEDEIQALLRQACQQGNAELIASFDADGKSGKLNRYIVLRKK